MTKSADSILALLIKTVNAGQWVWNTCTKTLQCDPRLLDLFNAQSEIQSGIDCTDFFVESCHPKDLTLVTNNISTAIQEGKELDIEFRIVVDAKLVHIRCIGIPEEIGKSTGKFTGICYQTQITELKSRIEMLEDVLYHIPNQVFWKDSDLNYLGCNKEFAEIVGLEHPNQVAGKTDYDFQRNPEHAELYRSDDQRIIDHGKPELEIEEPFYRSDGSEGYVLTSKVPLRDKQGDVYGILGICSDISERVKTEKALAKQTHLFEQQAHLLEMSEQRYRKAVEGAGAGIWTWNVLTNENYWSPAFYELLGFRPFEVIASYEEWESRINPNDKSRALDSLRAHLNKEGKYDVDFRLRCKNGEYRWFRVKGQAEFDKQGQPVHMAGYLIDIHRQKLLEIENKRLLDVFEELINFVPVMINSFDQEGNCLVWNKTCESVLGYSFEEAKSNPNLVENFYPDADVLNEVLQAISRPDGQFKEYPVIVKSGERHYQLWSNFRLSNDMVIGCGIDITDIRATEQKLEREKQRFHSVIENMPMGYHLWELDQSGELIFTDSNAAAGSILGFDHESLYGKCLEEAFPSLKGTELADEIKAIASQGGNFKQESLNYKDNKIDSVFSSQYFQCYPNAMVSIFSDISNTRRKELQLQETHKKLKLVTEGSQHGDMAIVSRTHRRR